MLGYGALYNHSKNPNAEIDFEENAPQDYVYFRAVKKIKSGEEIVYDYHFDKDKEEFLNNSPTPGKH